MYTCPTESRELHTSLLCAKTKRESGALLHVKPLSFVLLVRALCGGRATSHRTGLLSE